MYKERLVKKRKVLSMSIISIFYISFICNILLGIQSITNWNYNVHELFAIPINLAIISLPILGIIWLYYTIRSFELIKFTSTSLHIILRNIICTISILFIGIYFFVYFHGYSSAGVFEIESKVTNEDHYYIFISEKKVECTLNEYNLIVVGEQYSISFDSNVYWPNKGELRYIDRVIK